MASATKKPNLSTPDIPESAASFSLYSTTRINAPASLVFRTLRNTETWKDWNKYCPIVMIEEQPPEEDDITMAEIQELVRNTSLAGSLASDMLESTLPPNAPSRRRESVASQARSIAGQSPPDGAHEGTESDDEMKAINAALLVLPVTRQRLTSNASRTSAAEAVANVARAAQHPESGNRLRKASLTNQAAAVGAAASTEPPDSPTKPAAAVTNPDKPKYTNSPNGVMVESPADQSLLVPAPANTKSTQLAVATQGQQARRPSTDSAIRRDSKEKKRININALYGEPSIRIQIGTRMVLHVRMGLPYSQSTRECAVVVTEVSRPDDPADMIGSGSYSLQRSQTHTMSKSGVYRIVYEGTTKWDPPKSYPHFLLQFQRVHEIRPIVRGDGQDLECEYSTWELQKGMMASKNKKNVGKYLQERYDVWVKGLKEFCETMGGAVERRDFVIEE